MRNFRYDVVAAFCIWFPGIVITGLVWYRVVNEPLLRFLRYMPSHWYERELLEWRLISVAIMAFPVVILTFTTGRVFVTHIYVVMRLRALRFQPSPWVCMPVFRSLLGMSLTAAVTWSVGVGMFAILLVEVLSLPVIAMLGALGVLGAFGFCLPIYTLSRKLIDIRDWRIGRIVPIVVSLIEASDDDKDVIAEIYDWEKRVVDEYKIVREFLGWEVVTVIVGSGVIPIASSVLQIRLQN